MVEEGVEHPQPIEAMLHQLLELRLDDVQFVLLTRGTPRPALPPLRPSSGERQERRLYWVPNVEPLPMPPSIGVAGGVRGVGAWWPQLLLWCEAPNRRGPRWLPLRQGSPGEDPPEEVHMRLHPEEGLADGDEAGDV